jgi:hypothetical protein
MVGSAPVDATQAIADLTEISSQIELVVLLDGAGAVLGSNADDDARAGRLAAGAAQLLEEATPEGSVFVVREGDHTVVATTGPDPTVGLVFYDLKSALRGLDPPEKPKRAPRRKQEAAGGAA